MEADGCERARAPSHKSTAVREKEKSVVRGKWDWAQSRRNKQRAGKGNAWDISQETWLDHKIERKSLERTWGVWEMRYCTLVWCNSLLKSVQMHWEEFPGILIKLWQRRAHPVHLVGLGFVCLFAWLVLLLFSNYCVSHWKTRPLPIRTLSNFAHHFVPSL